MPRRATAKKRNIPPDAIHGSVTVAMIVNKVMLNGKKTTAERIVYRALDIIEDREKKKPVSILKQAVRNATPLLEVKPRRVGGATYQVPVEVRAGRDTALAIRWILKAARARTGKSMSEKLAAELLDASNGQGAAVKKREDTHKMAEANRAFAHYRW
ncbi:MAG: 30S ribosomal protein S7 [Dehalococcoidia bacterium]|nr:MAG: 30S ribosomal protein S7 [Dehalococcoidia bacterium]